MKLHRLALLGLVPVLVPLAACSGKLQVLSPPDAGPPAPIQFGKVDLVFAVDGSPSMGEKQALLAKAGAELVTRLVSPNCVAEGGAVTGRAHADGSCDQAGSHPEFPPVHDLHVGVITSSLGGGGATDVCEPGSGAPAPPVGKRHDDDRGHLVNRTRPVQGSAEGLVANAQPVQGNGGNFLAWLPASPLNAGSPAPNVTSYVDGQQARLASDVSSLLVGVGEYGCGLEAQLESVYRFLVQPDPYASLEMGALSPPRAQLVDVDVDLLAQRHDFLRDDSLVLVVLLTDEEDSWSDPMWEGGLGWTTSTQKFPGAPFGGGVMPRSTSECADPQNPNCTSCGFLGNKANGTPISADPSCQTPSGVGMGYYTPDEDGLNVRYTDDMKRRYGVAPQFDVDRYVRGFTSARVPDREGEHPGGGVSYAGTANCTNPLFAKGPLPADATGELCNLPAGPRDPKMVFFAVVGGVPPRLVEDAPGHLKPSLGATDWQKILGKDPASFRQDGIDPHMIESITPRAALEAPGGTYTLGTDPDTGREWNTHSSYVKIDLQYACTFQLPQPMDCTKPEHAGSCDCVDTATTTADGPPVCDPANRNLQVRGKAYPSIRELRVVKELGDQGIAASVCPTNEADATKADFGYRPVLEGIVARLTPTLVARSH